MTEPFFFTWSAQDSATPIEIVGGKGAYIELKGGARILDFASLSYQANLGYGNARIVEAIQSQAGRLLLTTPNGVFPEKRALAEKLLQHAPKGFSKVFFTLGGAEATENAIKIARLFTGRHKLLSRYRSYHGATMGALSLSGDYRRPPLEPGLVGVVHTLDSYLSRLPGGDAIEEGGGSAESLARTLSLEGQIAGVFLEPVPGANGCLVPPDGYWDQVRSACDAHGALLIADCVLNGFGRLGTWYGFEDLMNGAPDIITVSKGITGGYAPLGAVLVHDRIAKHFDKNVLYAGLTFYGHPLGVAAGLAALGVYEDDSLIARAKQLGVTFASSIAALQDEFPHVLIKTRALGLLGALEFGSDAHFEKVCSAVDRANLMVHPNKRIRSVILSPPLVISEIELADGFERLRTALANISK